jgi:hypothetical protein
MTHLVLFTVPPPWVGGGVAGADYSASAAMIAPPVTSSLEGKALACVFSLGSAVDCGMLLLLNTDAKSSSESVLSMVSRFFLCPVRSTVLLPIPCCVVARESSSSCKGHGLFFL